MRTRGIPGFEGRYAAGDDGHIYGGQGRRLHERVGKRGHRSVALYDANGRRRLHSVHRLVALAFIDNPEELPMVLHGDSNPANNMPANLRWGTGADNAHDAVKAGRNRNAAKTECPAQHPYDEANTYLDNQNRRHCRACMSARKERISS